MSTSRRPRLVVLAAGHGSNLQAIFDALDDGRLHAEVALVVSHRPDAHALVRAQQRGISTAVNTLAAIREAGGTRQDFDRWLTKIVHDAAPDLVVCVGWMLLLGSPFLETFSGRAINLHPALPGTFIGKEAIAQAWHAAQRGEITETGVMVHEVIAEMDAGEPIAVASLAVVPGEGLDGLTQRVHALEHQILIAAIRQKLGQSAS